MKGECTLSPEMSSEWDGGDEEGHDMYRHIWEQVDDDWDFNALGEQDWYVECTT